MNIVSKLLKNEQGATAVEYGLIVSMVSVLIVIGMMTAGYQVNQTLSTIADYLNTDS